ncbi:hypothetical protein ACHQM5_028850 [Ranunculus cassubicifolius]
MPRSREKVSEVPQRQTHKVPFMRTSSSESDTLHQRPIVDRSPKTGGRRSPRGSQADSLPQKKLGTRVADLESQLGQAQEELKKLKDQLVSTEAAKLKAQEELENKKTKPIVPESEDGNDEKSKPLVSSPLPPSEIQETNQTNDDISTDSPDMNTCETDVFEVPMTTVLDKTMMQEDAIETKSEEILSEQLLPEIEKPSSEEMILLKDEITSLKAKLEETDKQVELLQTENTNLNVKVTEMEAGIAVGRVKDEERELKLSETEVAVEASKVTIARLNQELESVRGEKEGLESEMKAMRVQTEQWRKAADAAAAILSGGTDKIGKFGGRCGSMDKHVGGGNVFELAGAYTGYEGSPLMPEDLDDRYGNGKRKSSGGIKMFGDLWKKKGQK